MLMCIGAVLGLLFFTRLRVDLLPQIVYPQVRASVTNEGVDPEILEQTVTRELEGALAAAENATRISSTTREGNASVLLEFAFGADIDVALADASAALDRVRAALPVEADAPVVFKADPSEIPVLELAATSDALDLVTLRDFADRTLADRLRHHPGVCERGRRRRARARARRHARPVAAARARARRARRGAARCTGGQPRRAGRRRDDGAARGARTHRGARALGDDCATPMPACPRGCVGRATSGAASVPPGTRTNG
jgi:hypothetical protein